jgi:flagellar basal body P-ring formation protein FlgA
MNPIKKVSGYLAAALWLVSQMGGGSFAGDLAIKVKEDVTVRGGTVTLKDIAVFTPETDPRVDALGRIDIASSPSPGNGVTLNRSFLNYKIGSSLSGRGEDITLEIPPTVILRRTSTTISAAQLERMFREHVRTHSSWDPEKIVFEKVDVPESVALPEGKVHWEIWDRGGDRYLGQVNLSVNFFVDGKQVRNVPISGKVSVKQELVKASRRINQGQVLAREDVSRVLESSTQLQRDVLIDPEEAVGKKALRTIQPGQAVSAQMLESPPVIKKGSRVQIVARNELIRVSASGKATEDGRMGEEVRVVNLSSGKEIQGTVKGPGVVEVMF